MWCGVGTSWYEVQYCNSCYAYALGALRMARPVGASLETGIACIKNSRGKLLAAHSRCGKIYRSYRCLLRNVLSLLCILGIKLMVKQFFIPHRVICSQVF